MLKHILLTGGMALTIAVGTGIGLAQQNGSLGGFRYDKKAPFEITSNKLEVRQAENLGIFTGNVVAGQGTLRLTAHRLNVHYNFSGGDSDTRLETDGETGAIERIDVFGNVLLCNGSDTAQGDAGTYDLAASRIYMEGNVILTQGGRAIAGPKLEINLDTGVGRVIGEPGKPVRSLLIPAKIGKANSKATLCDG